jgi:integrase
MASLHRRQDMDNRWQLDYTDVDGKRYRIDTGTKDEKIAVLWQSKAEELTSLARLGHIEKVGRLTREIVAGQESPQSSQRLRLDAFEKTYLERGEHDLDLAESTLKLHQCAFASFRAVARNKFLDGITAEDVRRWKRSMATHGRSKTTVGIYQRMLKSAFNRAVKWKILKESPFSEVELPTKKGEEKAPKSMDFEEVQTLLKIIDDQRFKRYLQILLYTGCRRNEILFLKREDIDLEQRVLHILAQKTRRRLALPINKALERILHEMQTNGELPNTGFLFQSKSNRRGKGKTEPWHPHSVTHWFKKFVRLAELPDHYSLHSCRHTYATYLRSQGVPQDVIQRLLGHSSVRTTDIYDHSDALFFRQYADLVDFEPPPSEPES